MIGTEAAAAARANAVAANSQSSSGKLAEKSHQPDDVIRPGTEEFAKLCSELDNRSLAYRFVKRLFDIVFSIAVIAACLIPGLILSVAIAIDTKGSPIYSQVRVGKYGQSFRVWKFRSMVSDSDDVEKYLSGDQLRQWEIERKVDDDPRITPLGRIIRKLSLDELPNFLNVFCGQISVIGPRAITYDELVHYGQRAAELLSVPQGITGLWQTGARNGATFESGERQRIELEYVQNASLGTDVKCFFATFSAMFGKRSGR